MPPAQERSIARKGQLDGLHPRNFSRIHFPGLRLRLQKLVCIVSQSQEDDRVPNCLHKPHRRLGVKLEGREHIPATNT